MNKTWNKLYSTIVMSSVWGASDATRIVWITMLALKDGGGTVWGSVDGLARAARVSEEDCEVALKYLIEPDRRSSSKEHDGRRIEVVDGGWTVLNHFKYRDGFEDVREKWRRQKKVQRAYKVNGSGPLPGEVLAVRAEENGASEAEVDRIVTESLPE